MDIVGRSMVTITRERYDFYISEIERLRQQVAVLREGLEEIADKESWNCCSVSRAMKGIAINTLAKATGGE